MKGKDVDDIEEFDFSDEAAFNKRFRRVEGEELIELKKRVAQARRAGVKSRVTIYLDTDIVSKFKETAEREKIGYQTLINNALREMVDRENKNAETQELKDELLRDKKFLRKLKTALAT